jgi:hypothetical protein
MSSDGVRVYVNERPVTVPPGSLAVDAVRELFPVVADELEQGRSRLTDSRGLPADHRQALVNGAIYRTVPVRDRAPESA